MATFATTALTMTTLPGAPCWWSSASLEHIFEAFKAVNNRVRDMTALNADATTTGKAVLGIVAACLAVLGGVQAVGLRRGDPG